MAAETLSFNILARDLASPAFKNIAASAGTASGSLGDLSDKLSDVSGRVAAARVKLEGDKEASAQLDKLGARIIQLSGRKIDPEVDLQGYLRTRAQITAIDLAMDKLDGKTAEVKVDVDRGALGRLGGLLGGGGGLGGIAGTAGGAVAIGAAIGPVLVGLSQIISALAAAGAGVTAFGALSIPQFTAISGALTQINTDTAAYERATTKASKATALKRIQQDWADISPPQRQAVKGIQSLGAEFTKLSNKLAPITFKVLNEGLKIANILLPMMLPFARAAGNAIDGLLKNFEKFAKSPAFAAWQAQLLKLTGPAITALGQGLGKIAISLGKLIQVSASPNSIKVLSGLLTVLAGTIDVISFVVGRASGKIIEWKNDFGDIGRVVGGAIAFIGNWNKNAGGALDAFGHKVATVFDGIRHTVAGFGHDIAAAFDTVRHTFADIGHSIANTFDRIRHFQGQFDAFGKDVEFVRHVITTAFDAIRHGGAIAFDALRHLIAAMWDRIWSDTTAMLATLRHGIAAAWDAIWHHSQDQASSGIGGIVRWFRSLPGRVIGALFGLGHQLYAFAHAALNEFWAGLRAVAGAVISWVGHFVSDIWNKVKRFFGISSPSSLFYSAGKNLMLGLFHGIKDHGHKAVAAAQAVSRRISDAGSGVQRWAPLVSAALRFEGLSPSLLGNVLYQMQTESGGNPNAINLNDINAQMGDPSRGLMQVIMGTFQAYHWPGTSRNIYDPLANIAAALNYARHVYGPTLMSGGMGIGSGHGYAAGSWQVPYTGPATVHKGEMIIPARAAAAIRAGGGGNTYVTVNVQVGHGTHPVAAAQEIVKVLNTGAMSGVKLRTSILGPG